MRAATVASNPMTPPPPSTLWQRAQRGWPPSFPLVQFPNAPLLVALAGGVVAEATDGSVSDYAQATSYAGLAAWAWLELTDGSNWARRVLGAAGIGFVVVRIADALGA